jgi:DNA topoisomerase-6 subunit B
MMPQPAKEVLPHPGDMDLKTLKKAILNFTNQKTTLLGVLCNSFQKLSAEKAKEIITRSGVEMKAADKYNEHELIKVVNICKQTKFQIPNTDHLSPIGEEILTAGMTSEYAIVINKQTHPAEHSQPQLSIKILKPSLTTYSSKICLINNRPTIVECGIAYGGDISSFKLYRFANKIPLLYDEGSDVAREVVSEVEINKMGISKKEVKEQFADPETKAVRAVELLPIHIFFHICSTKIPYKTAGKESIASEGDLKRYMKVCLADLYRKVSAQIRKELRIKEAESRLHLYKYYIPLIVNAISESIKVDPNRLSEAFTRIAERHVRGEIKYPIAERQDKITGERIDGEIHETTEVEDKILISRMAQDTQHEEKNRKTERKNQRSNKKNTQRKVQATLDILNVQKKTRGK